MTVMRLPISCTSSIIITGCAVAQQCAVVTMTSKVNWKTGYFATCGSETPENFTTKIGLLIMS